MATTENNGDLTQTGDSLDDWLDRFDERVSVDSISTLSMPVSIETNTENVAPAPSPGTWAKGIDRDGKFTIVTTPAGDKIYLTFERIVKNQYGHLSPEVRESMRLNAEQVYSDMVNDTNPHQATLSKGLANHFTRDTPLNLIRGGTGIWAYDRYTLASGNNRFTADAAIMDVNGDAFNLSLVNTLRHESFHFLDPLFKPGLNEQEATALEEHAMAETNRFRVADGMVERGRYIAMSPEELRAWQSANSDKTILRNASRVGDISVLIVEGRSERLYLNFAGVNNKARVKLETLMTELTRVNLGIAQETVNHLFELFSTIENPLSFSYDTVNDINFRGLEVNSAANTILISPNTNDELGVEDQYLNMRAEFSEFRPVDALYHQLLLLTYDKGVQKVAFYEHLLEEQNKLAAQYELDNYVLMGGTLVDGRIPTAKEIEDAFANDIDLGTRVVWPAELMLSMYRHPVVHWLEDQRHISATYGSNVLRTQFGIINRIAKPSTVDRLKGAYGELTGSQRNNLLMISPQKYTDSGAAWQGRDTTWSYFHRDDVTGTWEFRMDAGARQSEQVQASNVYLDPFFDHDDYVAPVEQMPEKADVLVLDLFHAGIETTPISGTDRVWDYDGDGYSYGTEWIGTDDAFLVYDRNGNGWIDDGTEMFSSNSLKSDGTYALNAFDALRDLDSNQDGVFDANDALFSKVGLWRDSDQKDGLYASPEELYSLEEVGIKSISTQVNNVDGTDQLEVTLVNDATIKAVSIDLATDIKHAVFSGETEKTEVSEKVQDLPDSVSINPNMLNLQAAADASPELEAILRQYSEATTRDEQLSLIDGLIQAWADTADYVQLIDRVNAHDVGTGFVVEQIKDSSVFDGYYPDNRSNGIASGVKLKFRITDLNGGYLSVDQLKVGDFADRPELELLAKIQVLEVFNDYSFYNLDGHIDDLGSHTWTGTLNGVPGTYHGGGAPDGYQDILSRVFITTRSESGGGAHISYGTAEGLPSEGYLDETDFKLSDTRMARMNDAYDLLKQSIYNNLVIQTRLAPMIESIVAAEGEELDLTALGELIDQKVAADTVDGVADLIDFNNSTAKDLIKRGVNGWEKLNDILATTTMTPELQKLLDEELGFSDGDTSIYDEGYGNLFGSDADNKLYDNGNRSMVSGGKGNDAIYSKHNTNGVLLDGGANNDTISAYRNLNATLLGGDGNDTLRNVVSENTVLHGGRGNDTLTSDYNGNVGARYLFNAGDEVDTIIGQKRADGGPKSNSTLSFGSGIAGIGQDITVSYENENRWDLLLTHSNGIDQVRIEDWYKWDSAKIDTIEFASGQVWQSSRISEVGLIREGTDGDDTITGLGIERVTYGEDDIDVEYSGGIVWTGRLDSNPKHGGYEWADGTSFDEKPFKSSETVGRKDYVNKLYGGAGNDTLTGGSVTDGDILEGGTGEDRLKGGSYAKNASLDGGADNDVVTGGYKSTASTLRGGQGEDTLTSGEGSENTTLFGGLDNDELSSGDYAKNTTLIGGLGDDSLTGNEYDDTYLFSLGDGQDTIYESWNGRVNGSAAPIDKLIFGYGIDAADISVSREGYDLTLSHSNGLDQITVAGWFLSTFGNELDDKEYKLEQIVFNDGTVWQGQDLTTQLLIQTGQDDVNDTLNGLDKGTIKRVNIGAINEKWVLDSSPDDADNYSIVYNANELHGGSGNDILTGGINSHNDVLIGGEGKDTLTAAQFSVDNRLEGGAGNDTLDALESSDGTILRGGAGDDTFDGFGAKNNTFEGGIGNDTIRGSLDFADTYIFNLGDGHDTITDRGHFLDDDGKLPVDKLLFGAGLKKENMRVLRDEEHGSDIYLTFVDDQGNETGDKITLESAYMGTSRSIGRGMMEQIIFANGDVITGEEVFTTAHTYTGDQYDNVLYGSYADDTLYGGAGNDQLYGRVDSDFLHGGTGNDILDGGSYSDTYLFNLGDGHDTIIEQSSESGIEGTEDRLVFGAGITTDDITVTNSGSNTVLSHRNGTDKVTMKNVEQLEFTGTDFDETFTAKRGVVNIFNGGGGDDTLKGGAFDDIYLFNLGGGHDTIVGTGKNDGSTDVLRFGAGISKGDLKISAEGNDLLITHSNGSDQVRVKDWYLGDGYQFENVEFVDNPDREIYNPWDTDLPWSKSYLHAQALLLEGSKNVDDIIISDSPLDEELYGYSGNDTLHGGAGNNKLYGGQGRDTYHFNLGDGQDLIHDIYHLSGNDLGKLKFGAGIVAADLTATRDGLDLLLSHRNGSDSVRFANWYKPTNYDDSRYEPSKYDSSYRSIEVEFADGVTWSPDELTALSGEWIYKTHVLNLGDGQITIDVTESGAIEGDKLAFGAGISGSDITVRYDGADIIFIHKNGSDQVRVKDWYQQLDAWETWDEHKLVYVEFADDGTLWASSDVEEMAGHVYGSDERDVLISNASVGHEDHLIHEHVYGLGGDDTLEARGTDTVHLHGGGDNDTLYGSDNGSFDGRIHLYGDDGDDKIHAGENGDYQTLYAGNGNDELYGGAGNDTLYAGRGHNLLKGGGGDDIYYFTKTDHNFSMGYEYEDKPGTHAIIYDDGGIDTVRLNPTGDDISDGDIWIFLYSGSMKAIVTAIDARSIKIEWEQFGEMTDNSLVLADVILKSESGYVIENFEVGGYIFDTGTEWYTSYELSYAELLELGNIQIGDSGAQLITGSDNDDALFGKAGNDRLSGGIGQDILHGGVDDDILEGGENRDTYHFMLGDGQDTIYDHSLNDDGMGNQLKFGAGIVASDISIVQDGDDLFFVHQNGTDHVRVKDWYLDASYRVEVVFDDGLTWSTQQSMFLAVEANINNKPSLDNAIVDQFTDEDGLLSFQIPADSFIDPEGDSLTYQVSMEDGSAFPAWLSFDAATQTFSGTPTNNEVGQLEIKVTATDSAAATTSDVFTLTVNNTNDAPVVNNAINAQVTDEDAEFSFQIPANTFADLDIGDSFSYEVSLADGRALPTWLSFDVASQTFSGTPRNDDVAQLDIKVTATDSGAVSVSDVFSLTVNNTNDRPEGSLYEHGHQHVKEGEAFSFQVPTDTFVDPDVGDTLTYTVMLDNYDEDPLPDWLHFDAAMQTFSGTPGNGDTGDIGIRVRATDESGAMRGAGFQIHVENINDAPVVDTAIADRVMNEGAAIFMRVDNTFSDPDERDWLTYTATLADGSDLPDWLDFNPTLLLLTGRSSQDDVGQLDIKITATDLSGASVSEAFTLKVNSRPELNAAINDQIIDEGAALSFQIPANTFSDRDGDELTYQAKMAYGSAWPSWLHFDAATQTFSGTPNDGDVGYLDIRVTASDGSGAKIDDVFKIRVNDINDSLVVNSAINDQSTDEDAFFSFQVPVGTFVDSDGDTLSYSATMADGGYWPSWLHFNAATQTFSGTPDNGDVAQLEVKVTASDGSASVSDVFSLMVNNTNDAPIANTEIASRRTDEGAAFSFQIPAGSFSDEDGDVLIYTATLNGGGALPTWLNFDAATQTFSGIPGNSDVGYIDVKVTASDGNGASISERFGLVVDDVEPAENNAPYINDAALPDPLGENSLYQIIAQDTDFAYSLPDGLIVDPDAGDSLSYSARLADGRALPSWLNFNATTGRFSGMPDNDDVGAYDIEVTATDNSGASTSSPLQLSFIVENSNDAPVLVTPIADQIVTQGESFVFEPASAFTDIDLKHLYVGDGTDMDNIQWETLSYSATLSNGAALPVWLNFEGMAETLTFSGTANNATVGVTVTATDSSGLSVSDTFMLTSVAAGMGGGSATGGGGLGSLIEVDDSYTLNYDAASAASGAAYWNDTTLVSGYDFDLDGEVLDKAPQSTYAGITDAFHFDGYGGGRMSDLAGLPGEQTKKSASFELWFRPDDLYDNDVLFETGSYGFLGTGTGTSFIMVDEDNDGVADDLQFVVKNGGTKRTLTADLSTILGRTTTLTNDFIQVVGTYDRNINGSSTDAVTLYVNGVEVDYDTATGLNDWSDAGNIGLGRVNGSINVGNSNVTNFEGDIAKFRFYEHALSSDTVSDNFDAVATPLGKVVPGTPYSETLTGTGQSDLFLSGAGNDQLNGLGGNDNYHFSRGDDQDVISDTGGDFDIINFGGDINQDDLWFTRNGGDLDITVVGTDDKLTIADWYSDVNSRVEFMSTTDDSAILVESQVEQLVSAMAAYNVPSGAGSVIPEDTKDALQSVVAASWG